jgi:hypothetical protein
LKSRLARVAGCRPDRKGTKKAFASQLGLARTPERADQAVGSEKRTDLFRSGR